MAIGLKRHQEKKKVPECGEALLILAIDGDISHKMIYAGFDGSFLSDPLMGLAVKERKPVV
ncbi:hypothetical protein FACS1894167_15230 [Synergistales bacterium]|nr:hypothetical protein FACS1894167_15230 [Synergistales bacterium]